MTSEPENKISYIKSRYLNPTRPAQILNYPHSCRVEVSRDIRWHTQDMLRPVSQAALNANPSSRIKYLAIPKRHCRWTIACSVISSPVKQVSKAAAFAKTTARTKELAKPRQLHRNFVPESPKLHVFSIGQPGEVWKVSEAAKSTDPSRWPRTQSLTVSHRPTEGVVHERPAETEISPAALRATAVGRLLDLAEPKESLLEKEPPYAIGGPSSITLVPKAALTAYANDRVKQLGEPRPLPSGYRADGPAERPVTRGALHYKASDRTNKLAIPIERANLYEQLL